MTEELVLYERAAPHVAVVTLDRPEARNAVNGALAKQLEAYVEQIEQDEDIWVGILTSSNDRVFCAGADLSELAAGNLAMNTAKGGFAGFVDYPRRKPWIAAVRGAALGGGCELSLACDMIVAAHTSAFGLPEVKRSLLAGAGGVFRLPRALPRNLALELVATGEPLPASEAHRFGLVNRLAEDGEVLSSALALAASIARNAPVAVRESLCIARLHADLSDAELRRLTTEAYRRLGATQDFAEGPRAFLEKRPPNWTGR